MLPQLDRQQLAPAPQAARPSSRDRLAGQGPGGPLQVVAREQRTLVDRVETDQLAGVVPGTGKTTLKVAERRAGAASVQA